MKSRGGYVLLGVAITIAALLAVLAQAQEPEPFLNVQGETRTATAPEGAEAVFIGWAVNLDAPYQVQRFSVYSTESSTLKVSIAGQGTNGDRWKATAQVWDDIPSTKTTTSNGVAGVYSAPVTMNIHGKIPLRARVEVRYFKGNNVFPAAAVVKMECDGSSMTATNLGISSF